MSNDADLLNISELKADGKWPLTNLPAYGMMPYLKRLQGELAGIEISIQSGENMFTLFEECPNIKMIYGVDPNYKKNAVTNLNYYGASYRLIKKSSREAAKDFDEEQVDFILVNGDHSYAEMKADLFLYYPLLKKGGHMFVHDTNPNCEDVLSAILDFKNDNKLRMPLNHSKNFVSFWTK